MAPKLNQKPQQKQKLSKTTKILIAGGSSVVIILIAVFIGLSIMSTPKQADGVVQTFTSVNKGNWNNASTWSTSGTSKTIPDSNDNVVISEKVTVNNTGTMADTIVLKGADLVIKSGGNLTFNHLQLQYTSQNVNSKYGSSTVYTPSKVDVKKGEIAISDDILFSSNGNTTKKHDVNVKNNGTLKLSGGFVNTGSGDLTVNSGGLLVLNGSSQQTMPGDNFASVNELKINNSASKSPQVKLNGDLTIKDTLALKNGVIKSSSSNSIEIGASGAVTGWDKNNSYIDGTYGQQGNPNDSLVFRLMGNKDMHKVAIHGLSYANTFQVNYHEKNPTNQFNNQMASGSNLNFVSVDEYWTIDKTTNNSTNCKVTLFWDNNTPSHIGNISQDTNLVVAHYNKSSQKWENEGHSNLKGNLNGQGSITSKGVSSFSPYTYGSKSSNSPLPVELIAFKVNQLKDRAKLTWKTASETNNSHFEVQKSQEGNEFTKIGKVEGSGTVIREQAYQFIDNEPNSGTSYYRLKQVDHDGSYEYSVVKAMKWEERKNDVNNSWVKINDISPNPFNNSFKVNYHLKEAGAVKISMRNMQGSIMFEKNLKGKSGPNTYRYDNDQQLSRGTYILALNGGGERVTKKVIKR